MPTAGRSSIWATRRGRLFHRTTREEARLCLEDRARKGFTVIQAVCLAERDGLRVPNAYGDLPFADAGFTRPNERYFTYVDEVVAMADSLGLVIGLLPAWGDKFCLKVGPRARDLHNGGACRGFRALSGGALPHPAEYHLDTGRRPSSRRA